jgi:hypothetical protein
MLQQAQLPVSQETLGELLLVSVTCDLALPEALQALQVFFLCSRALWRRAGFFFLARAAADTAGAARLFLPYSRLFFFPHSFSFFFFFFLFFFFFFLSVVIYSRSLFGTHRAEEAGWAPPPYIALFSFSEKEKRVGATPPSKA